MAILKRLLGFSNSSSKAQSRQVQYPSFSVLSRKIIEIGSDGIYPLIRPYCHAQVKEGNYIVTEPQLTDEQRKIFAKVRRAMMQILDVSPSKIRNEGALLKILEQKFQQILQDFSIQLSHDVYLNMMYYVYRDFMGLNEIEPLLRDPFIEDISCDGVGISVYIIHRRFGHMRTNIAFDSEEQLRDMVVKLAEKCGRYVSHAEPLMDGTLPDGTRVQTTLSKDVTTRGPSFSIRKFPEQPYTPADMMNFGTADEQILSYLWQLVENGANILVIGPTSSGKTSMLNTISFFVPAYAKIVSIEDTREINIMHENWLPAVARTSFSGTEVGEVTMFELLKESFRQNPNYLIVGEVRGEEANVMFQAMASGMATMSTMHAGSAEDAMKRLQLPPISLPPSMIETLDAVVLMTKAPEISGNARRIRSIKEVGKNGELGEFCFWDPSKDSFMVKSDSMVMERISYEKGISRNTLSRQMEEKAMLLRSLRGEKMQWKDVAQKISGYYGYGGKPAQELLGGKDEKSGKGESDEGA